MMSPCHERQSGSAYSEKRRRERESAVRIRFRSNSGSELTPNGRAVLMAELPRAKLHSLLETAWQATWVKSLHLGRDVAASYRWRGGGGRWEKFADYLSQIRRNDRLVEDSVDVLLPILPGHRFAQLGTEDHNLSGEAAFT